MGLVFVASSRPDRDERANFRTMPSSQSRSRLALRDLEVGSQDWWQEVSEIREKANNVANDRPMSRTSTRRSLASLASPESVPSTSERAARSRTDGRGVAPSASSRASLVDIAASQRPGSAAAVYDAKDHLRQTERPYTPQTRISDQPMSNGTASGQRRTHQAPQSPSTGEDHPHHKLLRDVSVPLSIVMYTCLRLACCRPCFHCKRPISYELAARCQRQRTLSELQGP